MQATVSEQAALPMNAGELKQAAKTTHGRFYTISTAHRLTSDLPPGDPVPIETLPAEPIWNSPWVATLFVSLISMEWILRKRAGLL